MHKQIELIIFGYKLKYPIVFFYEHKQINHDNFPQKYSHM